MIRVFLGPNSYVADFGADDDADTILDLFGTTQIPTPFRPPFPAEQAMTELRAKNPDRVLWFDDGITTDAARLEAHQQEDPHCTCDECIEDFAAKSDSVGLSAAVERIHAEAYPDGCPNMCEACTARLLAKLDQPCDNCGEHCPDSKTRADGEFCCDRCWRAALEHGHMHGLHTDEDGEAEAVEGCPLCHGKGRR